MSEKELTELVRGLSDEECKQILEFIKLLNAGKGGAA